MKKHIKNGITIIILLIILYFAYQFYQENNFNDFIRKESNLYTAEFKRDNTIKYSNQRSYKIKTNEYNDAMFSKEITVKKNTPYKVTCMVKTNEIQAEEPKTGIGAQIAISDTTERSVAVTGTNDWQKIELIFNSKNREKVEIGFRIGGYLGKAKGEVWFSDITIEEGITEENTNWNFACLIFKNTNVTINQKEIKLTINQNDISTITDTIHRFKNATQELSKQKMTANCDIYEIETPITSLSYDNEFGYYVAPEDIENQIKDIIGEKDYDHIFVIVRLGDEKHQTDIEINDWIGLGSMDYYGIGFSNIRLPNDSKSYIYKYSRGINEFPEEVFLHEFLHSLERNAEEYGYQIPALHDYEKYGYQNEVIYGQKKWYKDYMNQAIETSQGNVGLPKEIYGLKPAKKSNFEYTYTLNYFKEPENIIEEIRELFHHVINNVKGMVTQT